MCTDDVASRWGRVKQLFTDARTLPETERRAFLEQACADDVSLFDEVEALLRGHDAASGLFDEVDSLVISALVGAGVAPDSPDRTLPRGRRLGPYEIIERIGAGGMGEVYRAHDVRLHRDIALKTLPFQLVADAARRDRFTQEARAASALEHPHIAVIHDIGEADGMTFIAMELLRGQSLADAIARAPLTPVRALDLAIEIGEALARAHDRGIVHRDLKPANVMLTEDGHAKIIDFGLAKLVDPLREEDRTRTPARGSTEAGVLVGTASYMSPEQARGEGVDHRSDIFSFGIVLYEMLTGRAPFRGRSAIDTRHAILHDPAPLLPPLGLASDDLQQIIARCLAKEPQRRYQGLREAVVDLRTARRRIDSSQGRSIEGANRWRWPHHAAAAFVASLLIVAAVFEFRSANSLDPTARSQWVQITNLDVATQPALSPDGKLLTFIRGANAFYGPGDIYLKRLPDGEPVPLTRDGASKMQPAFSPDGSRIAYTLATAGDAWQTWTVPTWHGEPHMWLRNASALTWTNGRRVLYSRLTSGGRAGIVAASAIAAGETGIEIREVYVPAYGMAHRAFLSPGGRQVIVVEMNGRGAWMPCRLVSFDGSSAGRSLGHASAACTSAAWSPDGHWIYLAENVGGGFHIWRQRPDGSGLEQLTAGPMEEEGIAVAPDGRSLITSVGLARRSVWVHDKTGEHQVSVEGFAYWPLMTANGRKVCYRVLPTAGSGQSPAELWVTDLRSGRNDRVLPGKLVTGYDVAGDRIVAAVAERNGGSSIWLASVDGRQPPTRVARVVADNPRFVAGGRIALRQRDGGGYHIVTMNDDGTTVDVGGPVSSVLGTVSPRGEWLSDSRQDGMGLYSISRKSATPVFRGLDWARVRWTPDGTRMYVSVQYGSSTAFGEGRTFVIPLAPGTELPPIPAGGFKNEAELAAIPGTQVLPFGDVALSAAPDVYAFSRMTVTRNLYRIPIPGTR